ncbi:heme steroid-binding protein domain protein [Sporothrix brasiliensis 5110]|uniref:Heme steroid-binding protein domain protein n=1 Tax=Sporothrix brasiliensis 5110 TaxID=1398154 RepID=A0A0C2IVJ4_9PEZI|nr:heme steroid-binding protein domain protein [Sporothrix brasiliensis 5110]KIH90805.1 heme steroid-binding protein domain protein [Sporothrix brasiliensis 5110]
MSDNAARQRRFPLEPRVVDVTDLTDEDDDGNNGKPVTPPSTTTTPTTQPKRKTKGKKRPRVEEEDEYSPYLDIFRVLTFLLLASCGLSYLVSGGESFLWGMQHRPNYLKLSWWKMQYVGGDHGPYSSGPRYFTLEELAEYDGSVVEKPVYLSIDGNVFDVSAGRHIYGPGGSYHYFAGVDASRGFVTGCFADDRTGDLRGVEDMFLPLDNPEVDSHWTPAELAAKKVQERKDAVKRVHDAVQHWVDFFTKSHKYHYVGKLKREPGWEGELKPLCKAAQEGRAYREVPTKEGK